MSNNMCHVLSNVSIWLDHIGIAVQNLDQEISYYQTLGFQCTKPIVDSIQNVSLSLCQKDQNTALELVAAINEDSPNLGVLERRGATPYHLCFGVSSLDAFFMQLDKENFTYEIINPPQPAVLFEGCLVVFLFIPEIGLIELVEASQIDYLLEEAICQTTIKMIASDLTANIRFYQMLGYQVVNQSNLSRRGKYITLEKNHGGKIQILIPAKKTTEEDFLNTNGPGILQIYFLTDDLEVLVENMQDQHYEVEEFFEHGLKNIKRIVQFSEIDYNLFYEVYTKEDVTFPEIKMNNLLEGNLTASQQLIMDLDSFEDAQMKLTVLVQLKGELDPIILEQAIQKLRYKHSHLMVRLRQQGEKFQQVLSGGEVQFSYLKYESMNDQEQIKLVSEVMVAEKEKSFDLRIEGMRYILIKRGPGVYNLIVTAHSILLDQWSISQLISEIGQLYSQMSCSPIVESQVIQQEHNFLDHVCWEEEFQKSTGFELYENFWLDQYPQSPIQLELVIDQKSDQQGDVADYLIKISQEVTHKLVRLAEQRQVTLEELMLVGYSLLLRKVSQMETITIGIPVNTRVLEYQEKVTGNISNIIPLQVKMSDFTSFNQLLAQIHQQLHDNLEFMHYPLYSLIKNLDLQVERTNPIFSTMFTFWTDDKAGRFGEVEWSLIDYHYPLLGCDLILLVDRLLGDLQFRFTYNKNIFNQDWIRFFADRYLKVMDAIGELAKI